MAVYDNHRQEPYFPQVKQGTKTIEVRFKKGKYKDIKDGDTIIVHLQDNEEDNFAVKGIHEYPTFLEMFKNEEIERVLPGIATIDEAVKKSRQFYTEDRKKNLVYSQLRLN